MKRDPMKLSFLTLTMLLVMFTGGTSLNAQDDSLTSVTPSDASGNLRATPRAEAGEAADSSSDEPAESNPWPSEEASASDDFHADEIASSSQSFGDGVSLTESTPIHEILGDPDKYVGKRVRIEGGVLNVCPMEGCWAEVGDDQQSLRVKVEDGVIVFPSDAKGKILAAEGIVQANEVSREQYLGWLAHAAQERGEAFDPATADIGDGPYRILQIKGSGAEILED